jgi:hypothetical protein
LCINVHELEQKRGFAQGKRKPSAKKNLVTAALLHAFFAFSSGVVGAHLPKARAARGMVAVLSCTKAFNKPNMEIDLEASSRFF